MRIALLGYGRMGKMIESIAIERGHEIVLRVNEYNRTEVTMEQLRQADVAIEFSVPMVAVDHYNWCFETGIPVVSGTTGWLEDCVNKKREVFFMHPILVSESIYFFN